MASTPTWLSFSAPAAALLTAALMLGASGCSSSDPSCQQVQSRPMVLIKVTGDYTKVAQARACEQENTTCAPNDQWTDTGISGAPVAASQVPGTWKLLLASGTPSSLRIQLLDAKETVILDSVVPATWGTESAGACANVTYTNVDVALDS